MKIIYVILIKLYLGQESACAGVRAHGSMPVKRQDESAVCAVGVAVECYGSIQPFLKIFFNNICLTQK